MGWKGTVRSFGAAVRAAERDAKRRQRELERQEKEYEKMQHIEQAKYEVDVFENHIEVIQSIHKECNSRVDWEKIAVSKRPKKIEKVSDKESKAQIRLDKYQPGLVDRLLKRQERTRGMLEQKVIDGVKEDEQEYISKLSAWEKSVEDWKGSVDIAKSLLAGDVKAKLEAIESLDPFTEISNLGSSLSVSVHDNGVLEATISVHGTHIVPRKTKSLLKSGKLSIKDMPKGKFNEIYQDYVCSCVLRVSNELFSAVPDDLVIVTAIDDLLNTKTGHLEEAPILSALISRSTIEKLNLGALDPSDSMSNFIHEMSFKKTTGFNKVERVNVEG